MNIVFLGDKAVGKSTLIEKYFSSAWTWEHHHSCVSHFGGIFPEIHNIKTEFKTIIGINVREVWKAQSSKTIISRAKEKVDKILKKYHPSPLDDDIKKDLKKIYDNAYKKLVK